MSQSYQLPPQLLKKVIVIQRTKSGVTVIPPQLLKKVNLIHIFFFKSLSMFISVFASVVYAACIHESGIGERVGVRSGGGLSTLGRSQSRLALVTVLLSEPVTGLVAILVTKNTTV